MEIPSNYRGISITSALFTLIMNNRLYEGGAWGVMIATNVISSNQIGFMKGKRTSDHIFVLKCIIPGYPKRTTMEISASTFCVILIF